MKGRLGTAFILLSVAATASFVVLLTNRKRLKKQKEEAETQRIQHSALAARLKQSNKKLREQLENNRNPNDGKTAGRDAHAESFLDEPICRLVLQRVHEGQFKSQMDYAVYKKHALTREQLLALRTAADYHFDRFTSRLTDAYPKLSDGDIDYCCLYLLGLSNSDLSALLQRAYTTVNERNNRLKNIFNTKKPLSITLQEIAEKKTTV